MRTSAAERRTEGKRQKAEGGSDRATKRQSDEATEEIRALKKPLCPQAERLGVP